MYIFVSIVRACAHIHSSVPACKCTHTQMHTHRQRHKNAYAQRHKHIYTHVYTHTHTHTHTFCHNQNDSCIKMGTDESHFNTSLTMRDKVTIKTVSTDRNILKRKESRSGFEPRSLCA